MSFTSCSIIKILVPSLLILSKKFFKSDVSLWFIPAAGSSMTNKLGLVAKALQFPIAFGRHKEVRMLYY